MSWSDNLDKAQFAILNKYRTLYFRQIFENKLAELTSNFRDARNYYVSGQKKIKVILSYSHALFFV